MVQPAHDASSPRVKGFDALKGRFESQVKIMGEQMEEVEEQLKQALEDIEQRQPEVERLKRLRQSLLGQFHPKPKLPVTSGAAKGGSA